MKKTIKLFTALFLFALVLSQSIADAQIAPTVTLTVKNIHLLPDPVYNQDSVLIFEVWLLQTNQGQPGVDDYEYGNGQFTWSFNSEKIVDGADYFLSIIGLESELPQVLRPTAFQVDKVNGYLKMAGNIPQSLENYFISGTFPGTKIFTVKFRTSLKQFPELPLDLKFRLGAAPNTVLTYLLPYANGVDSNNFPSQFVSPIALDSMNATVENAGFVQPVELASFTADINRNNVTLNWSTSSELNNQGFEIERSLTGSNEWTKAGNVSGNGTTTESKGYTFSENLSTGHYTYRLKQIDFNGAFEYHALNNEVVVGVPSAFAISQNYPNPFNPTTKIDFELPTEGNVSVILYDVSGREIMKLVNENKPAGYYTVQMNASNLSSGMYFYRITSGSFVATKKMVVLK